MASSPGGLLGWWLLAYGLLPLVWTVVASADSGRPPQGTPQPVLPPGATPSMLPRPYLGLSVSALCVHMDASRVPEYAGEFKDVISVDIEGQGPTLFSLPRWNQGDYAPRLQPLRPFSMPDLVQVVSEEGAVFEGPHTTPAQAWRPSIEKGVVVGSVAQNGCKWNDTAPFFYGTIACNIDSHGFGYSMDTGEFGNQNPNIDIAVGKLGAFEEGNLDTAVAWFPYHQGWVAGYVDAPATYSPRASHSGWSSRWSFSPGLPEDAAQVVRWDEAGAALSLPGVDAASDGMLFLTSTNPLPGNNDLNIANAFVAYVEGRSSWRVQVREDNEVSPTKLCDPSQAMFAFLFVPYSAGGLIGGHTNGATGLPRVARGSFGSKRVSLGVYHLHIPRTPGLGYFHASEPLSNRDGMLLLQVVGQHPGHPGYAMHAVVSYAILSNGTVRVECHRYTRPEQLSNVAEEEYPPVDCDFYFAWVDFRTPLTPSPETYTGRSLGQPAWAPSFLAGLAAGLAVILMSLLSSAVGIALCSSATRYMARRYSVLAQAPLHAWTLPGGSGGGVSQGQQQQQQGEQFQQQQQRRQQGQQGLHVQEVVVAGLGEGGMLEEELLASSSSEGP